LAGSAYAGANLEYYHELVKNWSESKQARKKDWLATVKNWMLRDFKEGKLVTYEPTSYTQPTTTRLPMIISKARVLQLFLPSPAQSS
jgi:hypothetical protein